jgi:hypothetical protein
MYDVLFLQSGEGSTFLNMASRVIREQGFKTVYGSLVNGRYKLVPDAMEDGVWLNVRNTIVNWGCDLPINWGYTDRAPVIFNTPDAVKVCQDRLNLLSTLSSSIVRAYTPPFYTDKDSLIPGMKYIAYPERDRKLLSRPKMVDGAHPGDYPIYSSYRDTRTEFIVSVGIGGTILSIEPLVWNGDMVDMNVDDHQMPYIRSPNHGWWPAEAEDFLSEMNGGVLRSMCRVSVRAIHSLGLNFGQVKVGWRARNNNIWIFDVDPVLHSGSRGQERFSSSLLSHIQYVGEEIRMMEIAQDLHEDLLYEDRE